MGSGVTSTVLSSVIVGVVSQVWLRGYHPRWYNKFNYILGGDFFICLHFDNNDRLTIFVGALDGGAQVMIFILSFAVFGASGTRKPFPTWAGNPAVGNVDYCNGNGALDAN